MGKSKKRAREVVVEELDFIPLFGTTTDENNITNKPDQIKQKPTKSQSDKQQSKQQPNKQSNKHQKSQTAKQPNTQSNQQQKNQSNPPAKKQKQNHNQSVKQSTPPVTNDEQPVRPLFMLAQPKSNKKQRKSQPEPSPEPATIVDTIAATGDDDVMLVDPEPAPVADISDEQNGDNDAVDTIETSNVDDDIDVSNQTESLSGARTMYEPRPVAPVVPLITSKFVCTGSKFVRFTAHSTDPSNNNASKHVAYRLIFTPNERIVFHGSIRMLVREGSVTVNQSIFTAQPNTSSSSDAGKLDNITNYNGVQFVDLHSSLNDSHALMSIETGTQGARVELHQSLIPFSLSSIESTSQSINQSFNSSTTGTESANTAESNHQYLPIKIPGFYPLKQSSSLSALSLNPEWKDFITSTVQRFDKLKQSQPDSRDRVPCSVLMSGPRNSGKSTLLRLLINSVLNHHPSVLLLDLDCGQAEFGPASLVSLIELNKPILEPSFCHALHEPIAVRAMNDTTFADEPHTFIAAARSLFALAMIRPETPLLINTGGWVKGLGAKALQELVQWMQPSAVAHFVDMESRAKQTTYQSIKKASPHTWLQFLPRYQAPESLVRTRASAEQLRTIALSTYFIKKLVPTTSMAAELAAVRPVCISFDQVCVVMQNPVEPQLIFRALNCTIVSLCRKPVDQSINQTPQIDVNGLSVMSSFDRSSSPCYGLAIVRAIDEIKRCFYLLTPVPASKLASGLLMYRSSLELPGILVALPRTSRPQPYLVAAAMTGAGAAPIRGANRVIARKRLANE